MTPHEIHDYTVSTFKQHTGQKNAEGQEKVITTTKWTCMCGDKREVASESWE